MEPVLVRTNVRFDSASKAAIKSGVIHTDDCIRLAFERQKVKLVKQATKFKIVTFPIDILGNYRKLP